jgi:predicted DNA-binding transcriptional regulator AlpA
MPAYGASPSAAITQQLMAAGPTIKLPLAAAALGMSRTQAYVAIQRGEFPVPVIRVGRRVIIPVAPLLKLLGLELAEEHSQERLPTAMPLPGTTEEHRAVARAARVARAAQQLHAADRKAAEAAEVVQRACADAVEAIIELAPLLTAEQREQLCGALALPAAAAGRRPVTMRDAARSRADSPRDSLGHAVVRVCAREAIARRARGL